MAKGAVLASSIIGPSERNMILLLYAYAKNEFADLTPKQVAQLAKVVSEEFRNEE